MKSFRFSFFPSIGVFVFMFVSAFDCFAQINQTLPRFEKSDCVVPVPKGEKVECGYLVVRENRALKTDKSIRLPIIILKSDNPNPPPDPILRRLGEPGASSLRLITGRRFSPWLKNRKKSLRLGVEISFKITEFSSILRQLFQPFEEKSTKSRPRARLFRE